MEHMRAFLAYDTLCRITAELPDGSEGLLDQCEEEAHQLERTLSMFDPESELSRLCRDIRPGEETPVSETLLRFLEQNLEILCNSFTQIRGQAHFMLCDVLMMVLGQIQQLFDTIKSMFGL